MGKRDVATRLYQSMTSVTCAYVRQKQQGVNDLSVSCKNKIINSKVYDIKLTFTKSPFVTKANYHLLTGTETYKTYKIFFNITC